MANEIDVGGIVMRIRADMSGVKQGVDQLQREMGRMKGSTEQTGAGVETASKKMASTVKAGSLEQAAAYAAIATAATKAMQIIFSAIDTGINAINRYREALIGLGSVATGNGIGSDELQAALDQVSDAFFDVASASTAFKNLISRGYDLKQATESILRLKDAAAFGRQASLGLADAVVSATEGLKNENSILVDNAGVTKNVAKMWEDYAKAIGVSTDSLSKQQKIEAEYQGIMQETRFQVGDLAKLQMTLAGTQAATALAGEELARAYGEAMSPAVNTATQIWGEFLNMLTAAITQFPGVVAGLTTTGIALGGLVVAQKAAAAFQALSLSLTAASGAATLFGMSLKVAFPVLAAIGLAVGVATAIFTNHAEAERKAAEQAEAAAKKEIERKTALENSAEELGRLGTRFDELSGKQNLTYSESEELLEIERILKDQYGITGSALRNLANDYGTVSAAIREKYILTLKEQQAGKDAAAQAARTAFDEAQAKALAAQQYVTMGNKAEQLRDELNALYQTSKSGTAWVDFIRNQGNTLYAEIYNLEQAQLKLASSAGLKPEDMAGYAGARASAAAEFVRAQIDAIANEYEIGGGVIDSAAKKLLDSLFVGLAESPTNIIQAQPDQLMAAYSNALKSADVGPAITAMEDIQRKILLGAEPKDEDLTAIKTGWEQIFVYAQQAGASLGMSDAEILNFATSMAPVMTSAAASVGTVSEASALLFDLWKNQTLQSFVGGTADDMKKSMEDMRTATESETKRLNALGASLRGETGIIGALELLKTSMESGDAVMLEVARKGLESLGQQAPKTVEEINAALESHMAYRASTIDEMGQQLVGLNAMQTAFQAKQKALADEGKQNTPEYRALEAFIQRIKEAKRMADYDVAYEGLTLLHPDEAAKIDAATASTKDWMDTQTELNKQMETAAGLLADYNLQMQALQTLQAGYQTGETNTQAFKDAEAYLRSIPEFAYMALDSMDAVTMQLEMQQILITGTEAQIQDITARSQAYIDTLKQKLAGMDAGTTEYTTLNGMIVAFERLIELGGQLGSGAFNMTGVTQAFDMTKASAEELQAELDRSADKSRMLTKALEEKVSLRATIAEIKRVADAQMDNKASAEDWARAQRDAAAALGYTGSSAEQMSAQAALALGNVDSELAGLQPQIQSVMNWIQSLLSYIAGSSATLNINTSPAVSALNGLVSVWNAMANSFLGKLLGWKPVGGAAPKTSSGGGGGSKPDPAEDARRAAEEAAREAEEARREAVRADLRQLEHKKTMNQLTVQQEIAALLQIKRAHQLTADELMDIEERLYEARERLKNDAYQWALTLLDHQIAMGRVNVDQEIARLEEIKRAHELSTEELYQIEERLYNLRQSLLQEQEAQVKTTYDRIVRALKARYDEQKRMELDALDDRIDTLNAITKAENEADRRDDFAQNLADKQRELSVTKSARRRRELEAEIAEMQADEERRLAQEKRQAEIDEINKQKQAVNDKYASLAEEENLRQEALRLVMSNNLDQMAQLIASYGDKWQDAGAQLAEALTNGVLANSAGIIGTLNTLANSIQSNIDFQLRSVGSNLPAGSAGGVTVNMYGLTVREEADVDLVARAIQQKIQAAGR